MLGYTTFYVFLDSIPVDIPYAVDYVIAINNFTMVTRLKFFWNFTLLLFKI